MSPNNDPVMPIDHRDCFAGANKFCHGELSEYGFIVDSHFFDQQISPEHQNCLLYTSPSPRDRQKSRMPSSA